MNGQCDIMLDNWINVLQDKYVFFSIIRCLRAQSRFLQQDLIVKVWFVDNREFDPSSSSIIDLKDDNLKFISYKFDMQCEGKKCYELK